MTERACSRSSRLDIFGFARPSEEELSAWGAGNLRFIVFDPFDPVSTRAYFRCWVGLLSPRGLPRPASGNRRRMRKDRNERYAGGRRENEGAHKRTVYWVIGCSTEENAILGMKGWHKVNTSCFSCGRLKRLRQVPRAETNTLRPTRAHPASAVLPSTARCPLGQVGLQHSFWQFDNQQIRGWSSSANCQSLR